MHNVISFRCSLFFSLLSPPPLKISEKTIDPAAELCQNTFLVGRTIGLKIYSFTANRKGVMMIKLMWKEGREGGGNKRFGKMKQVENADSVLFLTGFILASGFGDSGQSAHFLGPHEGNALASIEEDRLVVCCKVASYKVTSSVNQFKFIFIWRHFLWRITSLHSSSFSFRLWACPAKEP